MTMTVEIQDAAGLVEWVERRVADKMPIVDYGVAHRGMGNPPTANEHVNLHFQLPDDAPNGGIIEHYTRDMTVRASAAATLGNLQRELAKQQQFLPIDADDDLTLGEIITHHMWGPWRVGYGSVRDHLLGLRYIDGLGRDIHVGGRTVKNVAGLDVTRLMVGSLNELGLIHEATLRTYAIPQQISTIDLRLNDPSKLGQAMTDWLVTEAAPAAMSMHLAMPCPQPQWTLRLAYVGKPLACAAQMRSLETLLETHPVLVEAGIHIVANGIRTLDEERNQNQTLTAWRRLAPAVVKLIAPPVHFGAAAQSLCEWASAHDHPLMIDALPVHGTLYAGGDLDADAAGHLDHAIEQLHQSIGGMRVWIQRPTSATFEPVAPAQSNHAFLATLKKTMDPHNLFNPGRYIQPHFSPA